MRSWKLACATCALLFLAVVSAQEEVQQAPSCDSHVQAAVSSLQAELRSMTDKHTHLLKEVQSCKGTYKDLQASIDAKVGEIGRLEASISSLRGQLVEAAKQASKKADLPTVMAALAELAQSGAHSAWQETKAIAQELQHGKTDKLSAAVACLLNHVKNAAAAASAFIATEADEHLPPAVKKQIKEAVSKVQALFKQHVVDADWAQPLLQKASGVSADVKKAVTQVVTSTPALAPLADPVMIELATYAIFAMPVLLAIVLPLAFTGRKAPAKPATTTSGKKKKGPKARA